MPVNATHPDYDANAAAWARARDVFAGEDAVKAAGDRYLPKLDAQTSDEYKAYKARASFFNATARTIDGFIGLIFRRKSTIKVPGDGSQESGAGKSGVGRALTSFIEDADMLGTPLESYAKNVVGEVIGVGRAGTLVDWTTSSGEPMGHGFEQRAYAVLYTAEQIINWRTERVNGRNVLTLVVLQEKAESRKQKAEIGDEFEWETVEQLRVLRLVNDRPHPGPLPRGEGVDGAHGVTRPTQWQYVVEIWRQVLVDERGSRRGKKKWVLLDTRIPLRLGNPKSCRRC